MVRKFSRKILISTNSSCNLKCVYCFEKNKVDHEFDVSSAASMIGELLEKRTEYGTKIKIHGGEPFLVFDKIKLLCETLWAMDYPEYYQFHITTNGTLIHGEVQDWLYKNKDKIRLKLSIDGNKKSNDINRPNSFEKIDLPFLIKTWPGLVASMTVTPMTLPFFSDNIKFLHSSGFENIVFQFSLMTDWKVFSLQDVFYRQMLVLVNFYLENPQIKPCFSWLKIEKTLRSAMPLCGIGRMKAFDFQSGRYFPCQMCFPSACGEETSLELQKIDFESASILSEGACSNCPFVNLCITCYAENYISRGAASRRDMNICSYQKILIASVFKYEYARILREEEPSMNDISKMEAILKWRNEVGEIEKKLSAKLGS